MTTDNLNENQPTQQELMEAAEQAIRDKKNSAFTKLLNQIFFQASGDGAVPHQSIGYAAADIISKTILIPRDAPKEFLSVRRNTSYNKVVELIKDAFPKFKGKIPFLDTIKDGSELEELILQRIKKHTLTSDGTMLSYEALNEKELRSRNSIIKNKQERINSVMHQVNTITQNFISLVEGFSQETDKLMAKYPDDDDIKEIANTAKAICKMHFTKFSEFDYVKFKED